MSTTVDTLRLIVTWDCNLSCSYCCNHRPDVLDRVQVLPLEVIPWHRYSTLCLTGGEPLLDILRLDGFMRAALAARYPNQFQRVVLYTNGRLLNRGTAWSLKRAGVTHLNVSLHDHPNPFEFIRLIRKATSRTGLQVRFHIEDRRQGNLWATLVSHGLAQVNLRTWTRGTCRRENEDLVALEDPPAKWRGGDQYQFGQVGGEISPKAGEA